MGKGYMEKHGCQEEGKARMCDYLTMYKDLHVWKYQDKIHHFVHCFSMKIDAEE